MDPYNVSYSQAPLAEAGNLQRQPSHGYQAVAQQPGYRQAPASFSAGLARQEDVGYCSDGYQTHPPAHHQTYQGGGPDHLTREYRRDGLVHGGRYGATAYQSSILPLPVAFVATTEPSQSRHHLLCTVVLMILCGIHLFIPAFIFLIPGLSFSLMARHYLRKGQFESGRRCGFGAYCCDTTAVLAYIFSLIAAFVVLVLWMTGVIFCSPLHKAC